MSACLDGKIEKDTPWNSSIEHLGNLKVDSAVIWFNVKYKAY